VDDLLDLILHQLLDYAYVIALSMSMFVACRVICVLSSKTKTSGMREYMPFLRA
jgi:hypothetical protein